jgi:hypothetical protein
VSRVYEPPSPLAGRVKTWRLFWRHPWRYLKALDEVQTTGRYGELWEVYERLGRER